ncbi:hypothetical protein [Helicobacter pullorum]|nr:hypothetical protein [Helicobacter pullorum]
MELLWTLVVLFCEVLVVLESLGVMACVVLSSRCVWITWVGDYWVFCGE